MVKGGYGGPFLLDLSPIQFSVKKYDLPTTQVTMYQMPYKTPSPTQPQPTIQFLPGLTLSINLLNFYRKLLKTMTYMVRNTRWPLVDVIQ